MKFQFFLFGFSGVGKFMADFFAKIFYARQNILKPSLTDLSYST